MLNIQDLANTPIPTILVVAGVVFLFIAVGGRLGAKLETPMIRTRAATAFGLLLIVSGISLFLIGQGDGDDGNGGGPEEVVPTIIMAPMEPNIDRPGGDFQNFNLPANDPAVCQRECRENARCEAWTFVKPNVQGPSPRCWLKDAVPAPQTSVCCVSGIKIRGE